MTLPAFAVKRRRLQHGAVQQVPAAIDRHLLPAWCSAANPPWLLSIDGTDRQTNGSTPTVTQITLYADSVSKKQADCIRRSIECVKPANLRH